MAQMEIHDFEEPPSNREANEPPSRSSMELLRAEEIRQLNEQLMDYLEVSEEQAVLLTPFEDGPIGALLTINEAINEGGHVDQITAAYVKNIANQSALDPIYDDTIKDSESIRKARPMSIAYHGGKGEILFNSLREMRDLSEDDRQIASNVQIQTGRLSLIQSNLEDFDDEFFVDFGYKRDASSEEINIPPFPESWDSRESSALKEECKALIRKLLYNKDYFNNSPLRSVEQVRAIILTNFSEADRPFLSRDIMSELDEVYNSLPGISDWGMQRRNAVTRSILKGMAESNILRAFRDDELKYEKGADWGSYSEIFKPYIDYYKDKRGEI